MYYVMRASAPSLHREYRLSDNSIKPTSCVSWLTLSPYLRELCGNPRSVTGVRVVSPKVLPCTLSHRDDSIASLTYF